MLRKVRKIKQMELFRLGESFMMASCDDMSINLTNVYTLNQTAAFLWDSIGASFIDISQIAKLMHERFDASVSVITKDISDHCEIWRGMGLIEIVGDSKR